MSDQAIKQLQEAYDAMACDLAVRTKQVRVKWERYEDRKKEERAWRD